MTGFLRRSGRSRDSKSRALDPILATRSTSWASTISVKRTQSWQSTGGNSTDLSLAYSSDTEVRDMLEELGVQRESDVTHDASSVGIVHPPHESPSRDSKSSALGPILATRSTSWASTISAKRTQSWRSTGGNSTDLSLAYSSDTEVRDMLEELGVERETRVAHDASSVGIVHPPHESPGLPRVPSKNVKARKPATIHIENNEVFDIALKSRLTFESEEKSARDFKIFVASRVDQALSPFDDKIEMLFVNMDHLAALQTPIEIESFSIDNYEDLPALSSIEKQLSSDNVAPSNPYKQLFSGLIESLFNDEPIPVIPASSFMSDDESSVATEDTSMNRQNAEEKPPAKFTLPTYTQVMEALLVDETMPDPLEPGIPSSIEIHRVSY